MKILTPRPLVRLLVLLAAELIFLISLSDSWGNDRNYMFSGAPCEVVIVLIFG
jgi:hypothetical protein